MSNISSVLSILSNVLQIVLLLLFKSFLAYSIVFVLSTIANNLILNYVANKRFPQYRCAGEIDKEMLADIKKRVMGVFIYRVCYVFRDAIDAIFICLFLIR